MKKFSVVQDYPVLDAVGPESDLSLVRVKGGGATNVTCFDAFRADHEFTCTRRNSMLNWAHADDYRNILLQPEIAAGFTVEDDYVISAPPVGDGWQERSGAAVVAQRVVVSGSCARLGFYVDGEYPSLGCAPMCFVALVLDRHCNGVLPDPANFFQHGGGTSYDDPTDFNISSFPLVRSGNSASRYRVLAFDNFSMACPVYRSLWYDGSEVGGGNKHLWEWNDFAHPFYFDVDLGDLEFKFSGNGSTVGDCVGNVLYVVSYLWNGINLQGAVSALTDYQRCALSYVSRFYFSDGLDAGDKPVLPTADDSVRAPVVIPGVGVSRNDLDVLADESAKLAGDGPSRVVSRGGFESVHSMFPVSVRDDPVESGRRLKKARYTGRSHAVRRAPSSRPWKRFAGSFVPFSDDPEIDAAESNSKRYKF